MPDTVEQHETTKNRLEFRCQHCGKLLFYWHPPETTQPGPLVVIKCRNDRCGRILYARLTSEQ